MLERYISYQFISVYDDQYLIVTAPIPMTYEIGSYQFISVYDDQYLIVTAPMPMTYEIGCVVIYLTNYSPLGFSL